MLRASIARNIPALRCNAAWAHGIHNVRRVVDWRPREIARVAHFRNREAIAGTLTGQKPTPGTPITETPISRYPSKDEVVKGGDLRREPVPTTQPSLVEQLFPEEEAKRKQELEQQKVRELPRQIIANNESLTAGKGGVSGHSNPRSSQTIGGRARLSSGPEETGEQRGAGAAVLILSNVNKNLLDEDFRRLVPQGKHMQGWSLQRGDITKIIPGRDLNTLAFAGYYYILFSSALSASAYRANALRTHRLVVTQSPKSLLSPIPPPPGYLINGVDAHAAMQSFTFGPPTQNLTFNIFLPPLSPFLDTLVRRGGYPGFVDRKDKMPFEARITLDGPQLNIRAIRNTIVTDARQRGLTWSNDSDIAPRLMQWMPPKKVTSSPRESSHTADKWAEKSQGRESEWSDASEDGNDQAMLEAEEALPDGSVNAIRSHNKRLVYIAGFPTERMLQSFVSYWHRRPIEDGVYDSDTSLEKDRAPIANVEVLW